MADPIKPVIDYSYTGFQQEQQDFPFPGTQLDNDLAKLAASDGAIIEFLKQIKILPGATTIADLQNLFDARYLRLSRSFVQPSDFGAVGDGVTDDTAALNKMFQTTDRLILIPAGVYRANSYLRLRANTRILGLPGATILRGTGGYTFLNGELENTTYAYGYGGDGNIFVDGLTLKFLYPGNNSDGSQAFGLSHGRNIHLRNITVDGWYRAHAIEVNGCDNVSIVNCRFINQVYTAGVDDNKEAIQIDKADVGSFYGFGASDNTDCRNILVQDCLVDGAWGGIGNHSGGAARHTNIRFIDNTIRNVYSFGIRSRWFFDSIISGNHVENVQGRGIHVQNSDNVTVEGNKCLGVGMNNGSPTSAVFFQTSTRCVFSETNRVDNTGYGSYSYALELGTSGTPSQDCTVRTKLCSPGASGVVSNNGIRTTINNATLYEVADDAAVSFSVRAHPLAQGVVSVSTASNGTSSIRGLYWVRTGTPGVETVAEIAGANIAKTTGILTGTTGTDGFMTISAHTDGNVYVENRSGSTRTVSISFLAA